MWQRWPQSSWISADVPDAHPGFGCVPGSAGSSRQRRLSLQSDHGWEEVRDNEVVTAHSQVGKWPGNLGATSSVGWGRGYVSQLAQRMPLV